MPLLQPRDFFSDHDTTTAFTRTGWLILFWGLVVGFVVGMINGPNPEFLELAGGDVPAWLVHIIYGIFAGVLGGIAAFIFSTLPAAWLHIVGLIFLRGRGATVLTNWVITAAVWVPMILVAPIATFVSSVPAIGTALSVALLLTLSVAAFRAVRIGVIFAYRAETVRAYLVTSIALAPLFAVIVAGIWV